MAFLDRLFDKGPHLVNPMEFPNLVHNAPAGQIAMLLGARGMNLATTQEELAGDEALAALAEAIAAGDVETALAGGGDLRSPWMQRGYAKIDRLLGTASAHSSAVGVVVLEDAASCRRRGRAPMARLLGMGAAGSWSGVEGAVGRALEAARRNGVAVAGVDLWLLGGTERLGRAHEARAARLPLLAGARRVQARTALGDAAGAGPAVVALGAAAVALGQAQTVLVTSVTRSGCARAVLLGGAA